MTGVFLGAVTSLGVFVLTVFPGSIGGAQATRHFGTAAWLASPVEIPAVEVERTCATLPHRDLFVEPPRSTGCTVIRHGVLDDVVSAAWSYALYRHISVYDPVGSTRPDTVIETDLVLFAASRRNRDRLTAIAHVREDYAQIADISVALAGHRQGALLGARFCLNGTGGCWQEFLQQRDSLWHELPDPYALLSAELRRAGVLHESGGPRLAMPNIDIKSLRGTSALYESGDANCCPARRVHFQLELTDRGFRLLRLNVAADTG